MIQILTCAQRKSYDSDLNLRAAQIIFLQIWTCAQRKSYDSDLNIGSAQRKSYDSDLNFGSADRKSILFNNKMNNN